MKKERWILLMLISFIVLNLINIFVLVIFSYSKDYKLTGKADNMGMVSFFIEDWRRINISSPENKTYNFAIGENYTIYLNVSSNFDAVSWWYTLNDKRNNLVVYQDFPFIPNTTFNAVRWDNEIIVYANDTSGGTVSESVKFYVNLPESAPNIHYIPPQIFVCEKNYTSTYFNVTDLDSQTPTPSINPTAPTSPFYVAYSSSINSTVKSYEIFSGTIDKLDLGGVNIGSKTFQENVSVSDSQYSDSKQTNITLIEINNAPSVAGIGVQTLWGVGDNRTFYHELSALDLESGMINEGNLTPQRIILNSSGKLAPIFNITPQGIINFTANKNLTGTYRVWIYVYDNGLINYHPNMTYYCNESHTNKSSMINFTITITNDNRPPYILTNYPINQSITEYEGEQVYFNVTMHDPDYTPVDSYWYFDDSLIEYDSGFDNGTFSEINTRLSYNSAGNHTIRVNVTDGNLTYSYDSFVWNITIIDVPIAFPTSGGAGGGGGGESGNPICIEKWGCSQWNECKNAKDSLKISLLTKEQYDLLFQECQEFSWNSGYCGFQRRDCEDIYSCNSTQNKPVLMQSCYYTDKPNCEDGIKNCHDQSCEILVDCGGPCNQCPTCSDNIKNQEEAEIDCGGPCKPCSTEKPSPKTPFRYFMVGLIIFLLLALILVSLRYLKVQRRARDDTKERFK